MEYQWINSEALKEVRNLKVALFGAGKGAEETLHYIQKINQRLTVCGVVDNDKSLHGKLFFDHPVFSPEELSQVEVDLIIVTSVSGKEAISHQLEKYGYASGSDFICIGRFPSGYSANFTDIIAIQNGQNIKGAKCLHIGPGGFLGVEMCLYSLGADFVYSIDKFSFGSDGYDITSRLTEYLEVRSYLEKISSSCSASETDIRLARFDSLIRKDGDCVTIDQEKIKYIQPVDIQSMPFEENYFDQVYSFALLEHVENPAQAVKELARVTRPGGKNLHTIVTRDHRSFSAFSEFHPFSYRFMDEDEWRETVKDKFYQNRIMPVQWNALFQKDNFRLLDYQVSEALDVDLYDYKLFHSDFMNYNKIELGESGCKLLLEKR